MNMLAWTSGSALLPAMHPKLPSWSSALIQIRYKILISKHYESKIVIIFLSINLNICFGCSKETSLGAQKNLSFERPKPMFWLKNTENKKKQLCNCVSKV